MMRLPGCRRRWKLRSGWGLSWCPLLRCPACMSTRKTSTSAATGWTWGRLRRPVSGRSTSGSRGPGRSSRSCEVRASTSISRTPYAKPATRSRSAGRTSPAPLGRGTTWALFRGVPGPGREGVRAAPLADRRAGGGADPRGRRRRRGRPPLLGRQGAGQGRGADPRPRRRRGRGLLPLPHQGADRPPPDPLRRAGSHPDRLVRLPRPDPQDLRPLRRLRHLRPSRAAGPVRRRVSAAPRK